jgi:hypothetical protein
MQTVDVPVLPTPVTEDAPQTLLERLKGGD